MKRSLYLYVSFMVLYSGSGSYAEKLYRAGLTVTIKSIMPEYGDHGNGQALLMDGEPLDMLISVENPYVGPLAAAERAWLSKVRMTLIEGELTSAGRIAGDLSCANRATLNDDSANNTPEFVVLERGTRQSLRCIIDPEELSLKPGVYVVTVSWTDEALADPSLRVDNEARAPALIQFELREVASEEDVLDRDLHLARRAFDDQRFNDAIALTTEVLKRDPRNSSALTLRGHAHRAAGNCRRAQDDWRRGVAVLEGSEDRRNKRALRQTQAERARLAKHFTDRANELRCR